MYVIKRDSRKERINFDKITSRLDALLDGLDQSKIFPKLISQKIAPKIANHMTTCEIDELAAETCVDMATIHPDYEKLAGRIVVSNLHKETPNTFSEAMEAINRRWWKSKPDTCNTEETLLDDTFMARVRKHETVLNAAINNQLDFQYNYFGIKTLRNSYLLKDTQKKVLERPQYMLMRVALMTNLDSIANTLRMYSLMSQRLFTHASPTLFNAGKKNGQLASCFLLDMTGDSIEGIYDTLKRCALISKNAGGIGLNVHCVRSENSLIKSSGGISDGIIPMLRVYQSTAKYVNQSGSRKGAFAVYLEPWHADIVDFLYLRRNDGEEEKRCRELHIGLWIPDLFMQRVENDSQWSLFSPDTAPGLHEVWGPAFETLYLQYETEHRYRKQMKARDLWNIIITSQIETGEPYMLYKDACNRKSNQQNLGTIKSSNLCSEIIEYTNPSEVAVCNLASIALPLCITTDAQGIKSFDFSKLYDTTYWVTFNLNNVIDTTYYPILEAERSNLRHRPIGIGVAGLADTFILLGYSFESIEAHTLNREIFETIYFAALKASNELAKRDEPYESYIGSPLSLGKFQFDLWNLENNSQTLLSNRWDWELLRTNILKYGVRNSLLLAPMPTASTSQILGINECFEPFTSNLFVRRVRAGDFVMVNKYLISDLEKLGLWNPNIKDQLIACNGSVQSLQIPNSLKQLYKTAWEIKLSTQIDLAADRARFIDQSQSFNIFMGEPNYERLTKMHFYGWKKGLKTGMYYLRTKPAVDPIKFTLDPALTKSNESGPVCSRDNPNCITCSL